jgi:peptidoglycan/LPS O-acetylase OafA/YrhL
MPSVPLSAILTRGSNNFDLVRIVAAASVIISHAFTQVYGPEATEPLASVSVYTLGGHAVNIFFILSGLLVAASLDRTPNLAAFTASRALRIFPGLIVCVLLVAFLMGPMVTAYSVGDYLASPDLYAYLVGTMSLVTTDGPLPGVFDSLPEAGIVNVPLWTLKYEVLAYALLTIVAVLGIWRNRLLFWIFIVGLISFHAAAEMTHAHPEEHGMVGHLSRFMICFFIGVVAFRLRDRIRLSLGGAITAALLLWVTNGTALEESIVYPAIGYLTFCFAALPMPRLRALTARGDISYGLYIYGWPVAQILVLVVPGIGAMELAVLSLVGAGLLASASWRFVERPALSLKPFATPSYRASIVS